MGPPPGDPSDEELMLAAQRGDREAFARIYDRHKNGLLSFNYRMLRNWEDAGDVFQDAFRYVHTHLAAWQPTARFATYLFQIARNMCIDILRRRKRWNLQPLDGRIEVAEDGGRELLRLDQGHLETRVKKALEEVPEAYREVLHLRVIEDLPYEEIAAILACPVGTVKSRLHTGLGLLRQILKRKNIVE